MDTKRAARLAKRRNWPEAFKRQLVAETLEPASSYARRHEAAMNLVAALAAPFVLRPLRQRRAAWLAPKRAVYTEALSA